MARDGMLPDDFAEKVSDIVFALKVLPDLRKVPMLEGH